MIGNSAGVGDGKIVDYGTIVVDEIKVVDGAGVGDVADVVVGDATAWVVDDGATGVVGNSTVRVSDVTVIGDGAGGIIDDGAGVGDVAVEIVGEDIVIGDGARVVGIAVCDNAAVIYDGIRVGDGTDKIFSTEDAARVNDESVVVSNGGSAKIINDATGFDGDGARVGDGTKIVGYCLICIVNRAKNVDIARVGDGAAVIDVTGEGGVVDGDGAGVGDGGSNEIFDDSEVDG